MLVGLFKIALKPLALTMSSQIILSLSIPGLSLVAVTCALLIQACVTVRTSLLSREDASF